MLVNENAYVAIGLVAIGLVPTVLLVLSDTKVGSIMLHRSLFMTMIFIAASLLSQVIYSNQMTKLQRIEIECLKKYIRDSTKQKRKRQSLIQLVDNRKSYDLTRWRDKNYPLVNNRYSSYTDKSISLPKYRKRVNSWHGELSILENPPSIRRRNVSMMPPSPLLSESEHYDDNLQTSSDFRSSLISTNSTIFENDDTGITNDSDSNIIDMSVDIGMDLDGSEYHKPTDFKEKTRYLATYMYDRFRNSHSGVKYNIRKDLAISPSFLKPFNLKNSETSST